MRHPRPHLLLRPPKHLQRRPLLLQHPKLLHLLQRLATLFTGRAPELAPAGETAMREAAGTSIDNDEDQWRRLTGHSNRDLSPLTQTRMQELSLYLWESNPLANWLIEIAVAYLLAEGVRPSVDDKQAQGWLDSFWDDRLSALKTAIEKDN